MRIIQSLTHLLIINLSHPHYFDKHENTKFWKHESTPPVNSLVIESGRCLHMCLIISGIISEGKQLHKQFVSFRSQPSKSSYIQLYCTYKYIWALISSIYMMICFPILCLRFSYCLHSLFQLFPAPVSSLVRSKQHLSTFTLPSSNTSIPHFQKMSQNRFSMKLPAFEVTRSHWSRSLLQHWSDSC